MKKIYETQEWKGNGKQNYYHNEYRTDGDKVYKVKCNRRKFFDGKENNWETSEKVTDRWEKSDSNLPDWLKKLLN